MATAEEALKHIQSHNNRNRPTLPPVIKQVVNGPTIKIFNIYDKSHLVPLGSLGTFYIPPCEAGKPYSKPLEIKAAYIDEYPYDMDLNGIKTTYNMVDGATEVAKEVVGTSAHKDSTANLTRWGVFVAAGDLPTEAELAAAKAALTKTMIELVAQADRIAMQGPLEAKNIGEHHRKALAFLNQKRDWATVSGQMDICPACGESINQGVAICRHCDAVLDDDRAKKFKLGPYRNVSVMPTPEPEAKPSKKS
jgi:hypothetical protein